MRSLWKTGFVIINHGGVPNATNDGVLVRWLLVQMHERPREVGLQKTLRM